MIRNNQVSDSQPLLSRWLCCHPSSGVCFRHTLVNEPTETDFIYTVDNQSRPIPAQAVFEKGDLDGSRIRNSLNTVPNDAENVWMCDSLQFSESGFVCENDFAQLRSVDLTGMVDDLGPPRGNIAIGGTFGSEYLVADRIGIDREETVFLEKLSYSALAATNATADHPPSLAIQHVEQQ